MKKILSLFLTLSLCASTIVGALCLNFNNAAAKPPTKDIYSGNLMEEVLKYYPSLQDVDRFNTFIDEHWDDYLFCCAIGDEGQIHIEAFENTGYDGWGVNFNGWISGYTPPYFDSGYHSEGYIHVDTVNNSFSSAIRGGSNISNYIYEYSFGGSNSFVPNIANFINSNLTWGWSKDIAYPINDSTLKLNFIKGHKDPYDNVVLNYYGRFYFTLSDQHYITQYTNEEKEGLYSYRVEMIDNQDNDYFINIGPYDWIRGPSDVPGVEEVLPGGVYWYDITNFVDYHNIVAVTYSSIPSLPNVFGSNRADIIRSSQEDNYMRFQEAFNDFLEHAAEIDKPTGLTTAAFQTLPKTAPCHVVPPVYDSGTYTFYSNQDTFHIYFGANDIYNQALKYDFNIAIVSYQLIYTALNQSGFLKQSYKLMQVQTNPQYNTVSIIDLPPSVVDYSFIFENYDLIVFCNYDDIKYQVDFNFDFCIDSPLIHNGSFADATAKGFYYVTSRASSTINYYYLADGFTKIQNHLLEWSSSWHSSVESIVSGIGALIYQTETLGGKLDSIFNYLQFDLSDKLNDILDKLDNIADNTSEESHGFWVLPLFDFVNRFSPSTSQFSDSINAIDEVFETIPTIPAIPSPSGS